MQPPRDLDGSLEGREARQGHPAQASGAAPTLRSLSHFAGGCLRREGCATPWESAGASLGEEVVSAAPAAVSVPFRGQSEGGSLTPLPLPRPPPRSR